MKNAPLIDELRERLAERILFLDGALGTMVQGHALEETDFCGERFADHPKDLKGNNDLLCLTQPELVRGIHADFLEAGCDIIQVEDPLVHFAAINPNVTTAGMEKWIDASSREVAGVFSPSSSILVKTA